jgi:hypothetical protein
MNKIVPFFAMLFAWINLCGGSTLAQTGGSIDGASLADLSLKTIASVAAQDRRGARSLWAQQIAALPQDQRNAATTRLLERLRQADVRTTKSDIASVLSSMPMPWVTKDTSSDSQYIYDLYIKESDDTIKRAVPGEFVVTLRLASETDRGNGTAKRSGQGRHGRAAVCQIVLLECCH